MTGRKGLRERARERERERDRDRDREFVHEFQHFPFYLIPPNRRVRVKG
jgi:hypothetical protein